MIMSAMNGDKTGPFAQKSILIKLLADEVTFELKNMIYNTIINCFILQYNILYYAYQNSDAFHSR